MLVSDGEILGRVAQLDRSAFEDFYDRYTARVFGFLLHLLRNRAEAEDVLQETFWQVWRQADRFDAGRASAEAWVLMIARSRAVDRLRRRREAVTDTIPEVPTDSQPEISLSRQDDAVQVTAALAVLPFDQQEPIRLAFFEGLTHEQIARHLKIPLGTVKTRIRLGFLRLRERLAAGVGE
ncbi:MAG: sigma-70 family RNA polymerase sigma factor [Gemmataceae bacterium]|nr:sigma-70 family RNA polymerase sigma factor [Gemmataceae bacterium]